MFLFQLWREYKLSTAEIMSAFSDAQIIYIDKTVCILDNLNVEKIQWIANKLWWIIKIAKLLEGSIEEFAERQEWKFQYWVSSFDKKIQLKKYLIDQKKRLKAAWVSSRFVNKDFANLSSAQIIAEKLITKQGDFSLVRINGKIEVFQSIWVQDIYNYSKRDYGKERDMQVGMLPPKLCQIMINIAGWKKVYDPFVGLWTVLLESLHMWNSEVYGSDLSETMVDTTWQNIKNFKSDYSIFSHVEKLNAKFVWEFSKLDEVDCIVSEWYLWEVMTQKNISFDRIEKQISSLEKIYEWFFNSLKKANYKWVIVICFPFWEINKKFVYAESLYKILEKYTNISEIIPSNTVPEKYIDFLCHSKSWSLLYKRDNQLVGREIFKLTIR